jgi:hypothetical protein
MQPGDNLAYQSELSVSWGSHWPTGCGLFLEFGGIDGIIGRERARGRSVKTYIDLPDELVAVYCPVEATPLGVDVYQITEINTDPEDTRWAFDTGAKVRCRPTPTSDGKETILVAYEQVSS